MSEVPDAFLINISRLLDRERMARAIATDGIAILSLWSIMWDLTSGFVIESASFVLMNPGEMPVTHSLSPVSWRKPSVMVRTAFFVPATAQGSVGWEQGNVQRQQLKLVLST